MSNITLTVELCQKDREKLDRILAALPGNKPDQEAHSGPTEDAGCERLTDLELADLFSYCARLARLVSPRDAMRYFRFEYGGEVADTLNGLAMLYAGELKTDFKTDELYGPTFRQMLSDIRRLLGIVEEVKA